MRPDGTGIASYKSIPFWDMRAGVGSYGFRISNFEFRICGAVRRSGQLGYVARVWAFQPRTLATCMHGVLPTSTGSPPVTLPEIPQARVGGFKFPRRFLAQVNSKFEIRNPKFSLPQGHHQAHARATNPKTRTAFPRAVKFEIRTSKFPEVGGRIEYRYSASVAMISMARSMGRWTIPSFSLTQP